MSNAELEQFVRDFNAFNKDNGYPFTVQPTLDHDIQTLGVNIEGEISISSRLQDEKIKTESLDTILFILHHEHCHLIKKDFLNNVAIHFSIPSNAIGIAWSSTASSFTPLGVLLATIPALFINCMLHKRLQEYAADAHATNKAPASETKNKIKYYFEELSYKPKYFLTKVSKPLINLANTHPPSKLRAKAMLEQMNWMMERGLHDDDGVPISTKSAANPVTPTI